MHSVDIAVLILRLGVGLTFAIHGAQKAFGWWGGPGPQRWRSAIGSMGFRPVALFALVSMLAELAGGILLVVGIVTPVAVAALVGQSVVIVFKVHWPKGFFSSNGGYEYPLQLAIGVVAIGLLGPGQLSLDHLAGLAPSATVRAAFLVIGAVGGLLSLSIPMVSAPPKDATKSS